MTDEKITSYEVTINRLASIELPVEIVMPMALSIGTKLKATIEDGKLVLEKIRQRCPSCGR